MPRPKCSVCKNCLQNITAHLCEWCHNIACQLCVVVVNKGQVICDNCYAEVLASKEYSKAPVDPPPFGPAVY